MAVKTIETKAVISAQDQTGATFAHVAQKLRSMENAANQASRRMAEAARYPAKQAHEAMTRTVRSAAVMNAIEGGAAALASSTVVRRIVQQSASRLHEQIRMSNSGMTAREIRNANEETAKLARDYKPVAQTDMLHMIRNTRSVVGAYTEAVGMMRPLLDLRVISQHTRPHASAEEINSDFDMLVKSAELAGVTGNHKRFENYIEGVARAMNVFGDTIRPHQFMEAAQYGRAATMGLSPEFVAGILPTMIQHHGGSQAGTALATFYSALVGGKMSNLAVNQLDKLGLLDESKVVRTKTGNVKGVDPGGIRGVDVARTDPHRWVWDFWAPALQKAGITSASAIAETTARAFSNRIATQFVTELVTQRPIFEKDAVLTAHAKGRSAARDIMEKDWDQSVRGLKNALDNRIGDLINGAARYIDGDPASANVGALAAVVGGMGGVATLSRLGLGALGFGVGGAGSAAAMTGIGLAGIGATWAGIKAGQGLQVLGGIARGQYYTTTDHEEIASLRQERDALEAEIAGIKQRQFDKSAYNPVLDQKMRRSADLRARIGASETARVLEDLGTVSPGLLAFDRMPANRVTGAGRLVAWSKAGAGRKVSYDEAMHPGGRNDATQSNPALRPPQKVDVAVHAEPMQIEVKSIVEASSQFLAVIEGAKLATREAKLHARVGAGSGSVGETDVGLHP